MWKSATMEVPMNKHEANAAFLEIVFWLMLAALFTFLS